MKKLISILFIAILSLSVTLMGACSGKSVDKQFKGNYQQATQEQSAQIAQELTNEDATSINKVLQGATVTEKMTMKSTSSVMGQSATMTVGYNFKGGYYQNQMVLGGNMSVSMMGKKLKTAIDSYSQIDLTNNLLKSYIKMESAGEEEKMMNTTHFNNCWNGLFTMGGNVAGEEAGGNTVSFVDIFAAISQDGGEIYFETTETGTKYKIILDTYYKNALDEIYSESMSDYEGININVTINEATLYLVLDTQGNLVDLMQDFSVAVNMKMSEDGVSMKTTVKMSIQTVIHVDETYTITPPTDLETYD